jgi:ABC-type transport system substrate-binding protein
MPTGAICCHSSNHPSPPARGRGEGEGAPPTKRSLQLAWRPIIVGVLLATATTACTPGSGPTSVNPQTTPPGPLAAKRIIAAIQSDPPVLARSINVANEPGLDVIQELTNPGLAIGDELGRLWPILTERVPSIDNGLWQVFPDGRMETTWPLRHDLLWHDGAPFTAADLTFAHRARQDPEVAFGPNAAYRSVESIDAPDPFTLVIRWKQPYIEADTAFNEENFPAHLLEQAYVEDKASFTQNPYWSGLLVGLGPYQMREWNRGSSLKLEAFDRYSLGDRKSIRSKSSSFQTRTRSLPTSWPARST